MPKLPDDPEQLRMSFAEHLEELRGRVIRGLLLVVGLFALGWFAFIGPLQIVFLRPHRLAIARLADRDPPLLIDDRLQYLTAVEPIFFQMKVALVMALLIGFPYLLWQLWAFIGAGLYPHERKAVTRYLPAAMLCGVFGILFGYFLMIPSVLEFLYSMPDQTLFQPNYRLADYFSIFMMFTLALALVFQTPLIILGLGSAGLVEPKTLRKYRRHFILVSFVLAAVLTPPDPTSQIFLAIPTIVLYEIGILLLSLRGHGNRRSGAGGSESAGGES